jgi:hypothetical protein
MTENVNFQKEAGDFAEKAKIFSEYFPEGRIEKINMTEVPEEALHFFEFKSGQFLSPNDYTLGNFENFFRVRHCDGKETFLAQQTKTYPKGFLEAGDTERLTYLVDMDGDKIIGRAELRLNLKCPEEYTEYFKDKPFIGWIETDKNLRGQGLGTRRIYLMNAYSRMLYGLPLYSDTVNSPEMENLWETLVRRGEARKFKEVEYNRFNALGKRKCDRYVLLAQN